jgi:hypothetical protein
MGKKHKKKKKLKKDMNKDEFRKIICSQCRVCHINSSLGFCYDSMYKADPKTFVKFCYKKLRNIKDWYILGDDSHASTTQMKVFEKVFCSSGICNFWRVDFTTGSQRSGHCRYSFGCFLEFNEQKKGKGDEGVCKRRKLKHIAGAAHYTKPKGHAKGKRYVCEPYPTFFINDNEEWKAHVKGVIDGSNGK